jgi:hypothetical protein
MTLNVGCRTTHGASEKRQRVLLSKKYEETVQDVSRQLADVKGMLETFMSNSDSGSSVRGPTDESLEFARHTPRSMIDEQLPVLASVHEGYVGDSSFQSHAHRIENALEATLTVSELTSVEARPLPHENVNDLLHMASAFTPDSSTREASKLSPRPHDLELENMPLPPLEIVLKLLRLVKGSKQRFFTDVPLFSETEFTELCRDIYFATEPVSLWAWISANVGLFFLFMGTSESDCNRMNMTVEATRSHCSILRDNAETALQSLRLCSEPSVESCRALALLVRSFQI